MRTATIGDDGRIYDADGKPYGKTSRAVKGQRGIGQYPQMREYARRENARPVEWYPRTYTDSPLQSRTRTSYNPHENASWYLKGLGQPREQMISNRARRPIALGQYSGPPNIPDACLAPAGGGAGAKLARSVAVPLADYTFTRAEGDPSKNVYPSRFVVSDKYPDTLFRVGYRASSSPTTVLLLTLQGQGAGNYIEVPITPDQGGKPSLMTDFMVVPEQCGWAVENSFINPLPIFGGGKENDSAKIGIT